MTARDVEAVPMDLRERIALAVYGSDEVEGWVDTLDFTTASEEVQQTCRAVADAVLAITEPDKAAAVRAALNAFADGLERRADAIYAQGLDEDDTDLIVADTRLSEAMRLRRRLAAEAGITVDTTTEEKP